MLFCRSFGMLGCGALPGSRPRLEAAAARAGAGACARQGRSTGATPDDEQAAEEQPDRDPEQERQLGAKVEVGSDAAEPSAFMRTTDQSPSRTFQVSVCVPTPEAEAAQKRWSVGGPSGAPPAIGKYVTRKGSKSTSSTFAWATIPRYLATSACGPTPMKSVLSPALSPRIRILPNQLSFKTQPASSVSTSSRVRVKA
jgi:hypothetical protein